MTADVFDRHVAELENLLEEGRTVEFNAMFMDRYLWNLQFGPSGIVPKKRASGTPIDGVIVSAGIPELDEAKALVASPAGGRPAPTSASSRHRRADPPGRGDCQGRGPTTILMQVEGGSAAATTPGSRWTTC